MIILYFLNINHYYYYYYYYYYYLLTFLIDVYLMQLPKSKLLDGAKILPKILTLWVGRKDTDGSCHKTNVT